MVILTKNEKDRKNLKLQKERNFYIYPIFIIEKKQNDNSL